MISDRDRKTVVKAVDYIRANDCDFLTAETVSIYAHTDIETAREVMLTDLSMPPKLVA